MNIIEIFTKSLILIFSFDRDLWEIIVLSLYVSIVALIFASFFGLLIGYFLAIKDFFLKNLILIILNSLMGIPPVVVGLIVYFIFASGGPLGVLQLLYTPRAMIIAQVIIIFPIVTSLSHEIFDQNWREYKDQLRSINMTYFGILFIISKHSYFLVITALLSAFGRAISEVGAVMIVGGNINHFTRVMTTAISLETRMGNLEYAMALGIVLILLTVLIYSLVYILNKRKI
tara:strand:- start:3361 stop:4050 length:690 start_codon:yes stop_codon:yes gene_type:complete